MVETEESFYSSLVVFTLYSWTDYLLLHNLTWKIVESICWKSQILILVRFKKREKTYGTFEFLDFKNWCVLVYDPFNCETRN